jgi:hypothetical protein
MLTSGARKNEHYQNILRRMKRLPGKRTLLHLNMDKSKWGPTFVPMQFIYLFSRFSDAMTGNLFTYFIHILIQHQNKMCILPERLMRAWLKYPEKIHHNDEFVQKMKEQFLSTNNTYFINEGNMGQGILHYTSSFLHVCMLSFRDEIYKRACRMANVNQFEMDDIVSSDDSYTCISMTQLKSEGDRESLNIFFRCQEISERLFNCRTSMNKSSFSLMVSEFNSMFGTNMGLHPTLFKFALSSVMPPCTDSFYRMTKECYGSSRQIIENGGSMQLYLVSQLLNKRFCESVYKTGEGLTNDISSFPGVRRENIPYQLGNFPIHDTATMIMYGPEFHNYKILKSQLSDEEKKLMKSCHRFIANDLVEVTADVNSVNTLFGGLLRVEARTGAIRQLNSLRLRCNADRGSLEQTLSVDPLMLFRRTNNLEELRTKIHMKLYQTSAAEAVRLTAASLYYGRSSAAVRKNAFYIPYTEIEGTFLECIKKMFETSHQELTLKEIHMLYPIYDEYDTLLEMSSIDTNYETRRSNTIKRSCVMYTTFRKTRTSNNVLTLLEWMWGDKEISDFQYNSFTRDWIILKGRCPILRDSLVETMETFTGLDRTIQTRLTLLVILRLIGDNVKKIKAVTYGRNTDNFVETMKILNDRNKFAGLERNLDSSLEGEYLHQDHGPLIWSFNYIMSQLDNGVSLGDIVVPHDEESIKAYMVDPTHSPVMRRKMLNLAMISRMNLRTKEWTELCEAPLHFWLIRQEYHLGNWIGDFDIICQMGSVKLRMKSHNNEIRIFGENIHRPRYLCKIFNHLKRLINFDSYIHEQGPWMIVDDEMRNTGTLLGYDIQMSRIDDVVTPQVETYIMHEDRMDLLDNMGQKISGMRLGYLSCDYHTNVYPDVDVHGLSFLKLSECGFFDPSIDLNIISRETLIYLLDDLNVPVPEISEFTKRRLEIINPEISTQKLNMNEMIGNLVSMGDDEIKIAMDEAMDDNENDIEFQLAALENTDLFMEFQDTRILTGGLKLWHLMRHMKYFIIANCVIRERDINNRVVKLFKSMSESDNSLIGIYYSLLAVYNWYYTNMSDESPRNMRLDVDEDFLIKFNLDI